MEKYCGMLQRVGDLTGGELIGPRDDYGRPTGVGHVRVATSLSVVQIGNTTLKKPRCDDDLFPYLQPGREACLYVYRHNWTPVLLGVKYADGNKHLVPSGYIRGTIIQFVIMFAFMYGIVGAIGGAFIGQPIGIGPVGVALGFAAGVGYAWWCAVKVWKDYSLAKAD
jgi:hypothetical protein